MRRTITAVLTALALLTATAGAAAAVSAVTPELSAPSNVTAITATAPSSVTALAAGNGTNNFYGKGFCGNNMGGWEWSELRFTNYDSGPNQTVHTAIRRSGTYVKFEVYINGVKVDSNDTEDYYSVRGHSRVVVGLRAWIGAGKRYTCSDSYT